MQINQKHAQASLATHSKPPRVELLFNRISTLHVIVLTEMVSVFI